MEDKELIDIPEDEMMLTTLDNPYNPKVDYNKWRNFDVDNGYCTEELIDRIADIPVDVEDPVTIDKMITEAIYSILDTPEFGIYKIV